MTCDLSQHVNTINIKSDKNKPSTFDSFAIIINILDIQDKKWKEMEFVRYQRCKPCNILEKPTLDFPVNSDTMFSVFNMI